MSARHLPFVLLAATFLAACGDAAVAPSPTATPVATASASTAPTTTAAPGAWTVTNASKAVVSVREQLVGVNAPSDAVLTATGAAGSFLVNPDGTFSADSKITFDVTSLQSDQSLRDNFVKGSVLQTRQFPTATFVPTKATGLALPLASNADLSFTLAGKMTIHGVTKDVTFTVTGKRTGNSLTATAAAAPNWKFEDFGMTAPSVPTRVVSVTDDIRLVVQLAATTTAG